MDPYTYTTHPIMGVVSDYFVPKVEIIPPLPAHSSSFSSPSSIEIPPPITELRNNRNSFNNNGNNNKSNIYNNNGSFNINNITSKNNITFAYGNNNSKRPPHIITPESPSISPSPSPSSSLSTASSTSSLSSLSLSSPLSSSSSSSSINSLSPSLSSPSFNNNPLSSPSFNSLSSPRFFFNPPSPPSEDDPNYFIDSYTKIRTLSGEIFQCAGETLAKGFATDNAKIEFYANELLKVARQLNNNSNIDDDDKKRPTPPLVRPRRIRRKHIDEEEIDDLEKKRKIAAVANTAEMYCHSCGTTDTPEWRRGPDNCKSLCNACGLHYAKMLRRETMIPNRAPARTTMTLNNLLN